MNMYTNQEIQVKWNTLLSSKCKTSNGVKQGGCLSPSLFSVYLNKLIVNLRNSNIGRRYRFEYMGVFGYADDLSFLMQTQDTHHNLVMNYLNYVDATLYV